MKKQHIKNAIGRSTIKENKRADTFIPLKIEGFKLYLMKGGFKK